MQNYYTEIDLPPQRLLPGFVTSSALAQTIWNHPQWVGDTLSGGISTNYGASNFSAVTSAYAPRTIQLGLKLSF